MIDLKALLLEPEQKILPSSHSMDILELPGNLGTLRIEIEWTNISTRDWVHSDDRLKRKGPINIVLYQNRLLEEKVPHVFKSDLIKDDLIIYVKNIGGLSYHCYLEPKKDDLNIYELMTNIENIKPKNVTIGGIVKSKTESDIHHHDPEVIYPLEKLKRKL